MAKAISLFAWCVPVSTARWSKWSAQRRNGSINQNKNAHNKQIAKATLHRALILHEPGGKWWKWWRHKTNSMKSFFGSAFLANMLNSEDYSLSTCVSALKRNKIYSWCDHRQSDTIKHYTCASFSLLARCVISFHLISAPFRVCVFGCFFYTYIFILSFSFRRVQ